MSESRAEHYAESDEQTVRHSRAIVRYALERHARGRSAALSGRALAEQTPLKSTTVRDIIAELRDDPTAPPIGNCGNGYYVIETTEELEDWLAQKNQEIETKRNRMQQTVKSFNRSKRHE